MEIARRDTYIESLKWNLLTRRYEQNVENGLPYKVAAKDAVAYTDALLSTLEETWSEKGGRQ